MLKMRKEPSCRNLAELNCEPLGCHEIADNQQTEWKTNCLHNSKKKSRFSVFVVVVVVANRTQIRNSSKWQLKIQRIRNSTNVQQSQNVLLGAMEIDLYIADGSRTDWSAIENFNTCSQQCPSRARMLNHLMI